MYSAVKKDGRKLYEYARQGEEVVREPRTVTVYALELLETGADRATFRCVCSGGTYVRTIAHDLGRAIGCGAHVSALERTKVGRFVVEDAVAPDQATERDLLPLIEALSPLPVIALDEAQIEHVRHGCTLRVPQVPNEPLVALTDRSGEVVCVARVWENELHPETVIPSEAIHGAV
jgi:tRNA pseudouridine55 synthase